MVKLYGTLGANVNGYNHLQGLKVDLRHDATVGELLAELGIVKSQKVVVAVDSRIQKTEDRIPNGAHVHVFQPMHGG